MVARPARIASAGPVSKVIARLAAVWCPLLATVHPQHPVVAGSCGPINHSAPERDPRLTSRRGACRPALIVPAARGVHPRDLTGDPVRDVVNERRHYAVANRRGYVAEDLGLAHPRTGPDAYADAVPDSGRDADDDRERDERPDRLTDRGHARAFTRGEC